jgi:ribonuclease P/MRP protein subunit RPP40
MNVQRQAFPTLSSSRQTKLYKHPSHPPNTSINPAHRLHHDKGKSKLETQRFIRSSDAGNKFIFRHHHKTSQQHSNLTYFQKHKKNHKLQKPHPKAGKQASHLRNTNHQLSGEKTSTMLDIGKSSNLPTPKCYFNTTALPSYTDPSELPTKKAPFNLLHRTPYYHTVTLITPTSSPLDFASTPPAKYARVQFPLLHLLQGEFFTKHIKTGNILLLSSPLKVDATSSEARFTLINGILTILCDRALYERAGLSGQAIPDPHARKHGTSKFRIEVNLRLPSMLAGKKGFERLVRAAEMVFVGDMTWLFYDCASDGVGSADSTLGSEATIKDVKMEREELGKIVVPEFPKKEIMKEGDEVVELLEWISLAAVGSPRVEQGDLVDEIISRYEVPDFSTPSTDPVPSTTNQSPGTTTQNLTKTTYTGFMPSSSISSVFGETLIQSKDSWFAFLMQGFEEGKAVVILKMGDQRVLSWDVEG